MRSMARGCKRHVGETAHWKERHRGLENLNSLIGQRTDGVNLLSDVVFSPSSTLTTASTTSKAGGRL